MIQNALSVFQSSWNKHCIRAVGVPELMYKQNKMKVTLLREQMSIQNVVEAYISEGGIIGEQAPQYDFFLIEEDNKWLEILNAGNLDPFIELYYQWIQ